MSRRFSRAGGRHPLAAFLLAAFALPAGAAAELSLVGADDGSIELAVPASGRVPLVFHRAPVEDAAAFDVDLGAFLSEGDQVASVALGPGGGAGPAGVARLAFAEGEHRAVVELRAEGLVPGVEYTGTLSAGSPEGVTTWRLTLHRPDPPGEPVTDLGKVVLDVVLGAGGEEAARTLVVREKSGDVAIEGLTVRRADGSEPKGTIDLSRNLRFELDGRPIPDLTSWPDGAHGAPRTIPPGEQRTLLVGVQDLPRGEHELSLQLGAVNAEPGAAPRIDLTVRVRHSIVWAFLVLLVAIMISFLITKGIVNWRRRLRLQARARSLRRDWLRELPSLAPVIWLQATRRQAEMVLDRFPLLPAPEQAAERLDRAVLLLGVLRRYRDLRSRLDQCPFPYMLRWRMGDELDDVVRRIEPDFLDDAAAAPFTALLEAYEKDLATPVARYGPLVMTARKRVKAEVRLGEIPATKKQRARLEALMEECVETDPPPGAGEEELVLIDRVCSGLQVLWRHRGDDDLLAQLLELVARDEAADIPIGRVFELTNEDTAKRLQEKIDPDDWYLSPTGKRARASQVEALQPTRFEVGVEDRELDEGFMLKSRMIADWRFELVPQTQRVWRRAWRRLWRKQPPEPIRWNETCPGKVLYQFAQQSGTLTVAVSLRHETIRTQPVEGELPIAPSYGLRSVLPALEEWVLVGVSSVIALASGLVLYYLPNPTFGSLQDYLALFTWGVGVDQGKNLVQTLQSLRSQSKADEEGSAK